MARASRRTSRRPTARVGRVVLLVLGIGGVWTLTGSCTTPQTRIDAAIAEDASAATDAPDAPTSADAPPDDSSSVDAPSVDAPIDVPVDDDAGCESRFGTATFGAGCFG